MNVRKVKYYNQGIVKVPPKDIKMSKLLWLGIADNIFKGRKFLRDELCGRQKKHCKNE